MKILILAAEQHFSNSFDKNYPVCLTELKGKTLIEHIISSSQKLLPKKIIIAISSKDAKNFHLNNSLISLASNIEALIVNNTSGAACTALLAIEHINNDDELLILNGNELLDVDFNQIIHSFRMQNFDAGTVVFSSFHPRYSYVKMNAEKLIIQTAEKNPISAWATAGFYWYSKGRNFVEAAQEMIAKGASIKEKFYICPVFNELILKHARIGSYEIAPTQYYPLKSEHQILEQISNFRIKEKA